MERASLVPAGFPGRALWILLALALLLRLGTNGSRIDEWFREGLIRGAYAQALVEDAPIWPSQTPQLPHIRGSLVMSWIAVPFFGVMGPTTFAVRIGGILFHLVTLWLLMLLAHRQFGRRAALFGGALFVLCPPALAKIAVLSYGDHYEGLAFVFGAALLALTWTDDRTGRRIGLAFATGLVAGLALAWHAQSRLGVAVLALCCLIAAPGKLLGRDTWLGLLPGALLGYLPMWIGDRLTATSGVEVQGHGPLEMFLNGLQWERLAKWTTLWTEDLAHALQYPSVVFGAFTMLLVAACALGLAMAAWKRLRRREIGWNACWRRSAFFCIYPFVFSAVYALSRFDVLHGTDNAIQVRYVLPVVPFLLMAIAVGGARLLEAGRGGLAAAVLVPALGLGTWGSLSTIDPDTILNEPARTSVSWESYAKHFQYATLSPAEQAELRELELSLRGDPAQAARVRQFVEAHTDPHALLDLIEAHDPHAAWTWPLRFNIPGLVEPVLAAGPAQARLRLAAVDERFRRFVCVAGGSRLGQAGHLPADAVAVLLDAARDSEDTRHILRGLGMGFGNVGLPRFWEGRQAALRMERLPARADRNEVAWGLGFRIGTLVTAFYWPGDHLVAEVLEHLPPAVHGGFARGLGAGYRIRFLQPPDAALDSPSVRRLIGLLPTRNEADFRAGLGGSAEAR